MTKILIVDDEKLERKGICFLLKERIEEMEVLEASNGKAALEILQKTPVDILFTDIKMPFMNGIELVEYARNLQPDIEMVIFSGYGEFEYARRAMKFGVDNYVLKPVDTKEFHDTVDKIFRKIISRNQVRQVNKWNQDFLEEYFLGKYLYQRGEMLSKIGEKVNLDSWKEIKGLILVESEDNFFEESEEEFQNKMIDEIQQRLSFLNLGQNQELCILRSDCDQKVLAGHICNWLNTQFGERFYVAVGRPVTEIEEMPEVFRELDELMESKFYQKEKRLFLPEEELGQTEREEFLGEILDRMIGDIRVEDMTHLWEHYRILENSVKRLVQYSQIYTKFMFSNLVKAFYKHQQMDGKKLEMAIQKVYELSSIGEVLFMVEGLIQDMGKRLSETKNGSRDEIAQAKSYIYSHYNEELSVEILAEKVYLSPGYFSYIFKKETGVNLSRFVRMYRMDKAKELLTGTNMKIVQVCKETGFSNVSYFCKNFREYCGCSPEQYRKGELPSE